MDFCNIINYKDNSITIMECGVTVFHEGEELYFDTVDDAKSYIDSIV